MKEPIVPVEGTPRRRRDKPIAEGGTRPHLGVCPSCGAAVIHHRRAVSHAAILLVPEPRVGARFVIFMGSVFEDPDPRCLPADMVPHDEHACPTIEKASTP